MSASKLLRAAERRMDTLSRREQSHDDDVLRLLDRARAAAQWTRLDAELEVEAIRSAHAAGLLSDDLASEAVYSWVGALRASASILGRVELLRRLWARRRIPWWEEVDGPEAEARRVEEVYEGHNREIVSAHVNDGQ